MGTYTTNYNLFLPTVGEQGWGTLVNGNFTTIDTTMAGLNTRLTAVESRVVTVESEVTTIKSNITTINGNISNIQTNGSKHRGTIVTSKPYIWSPPLQVNTIFSFTNKSSTATTSQSTSISLLPCAGWEVITNPKSTTTYTITYTPFDSNYYYITTATFTFKSLYDNTTTSKTCSCGKYSATYTVTAPVLCSITCQATVKTYGETSGKASTLKVVGGVAYIRLA